MEDWAKRGQKTPGRIEEDGLSAAWGGIKNLDLSVLCDRVVEVGSVDNFAEC